MRNPPSYCLSLPFLKEYASICLRLYNVSEMNRNFLHLFKFSYFHDHLLAVNVEFYLKNCKQKWKFNLKLNKNYESKVSFLATIWRKASWWLHAIRRWTVSCSRGYRTCRMFLYTDLKSHNERNHKEYFIFISLNFKRIFKKHINDMLAYDN